MERWLPIVLNLIWAIAMMGLAIDSWVHRRESAETAISGRVLALSERMTLLDSKLDRFLGKQSDLGDQWQKKFTDIEIIQAVQREHIEQLTRDLTRLQRL